MTRWETDAYPGFHPDGPQGVIDPILDIFDAFTLTGFDDQQIETFIQAWYNAQKELGQVNAVQAEQKASDLTQAALTADLYELAVNPMLLTTMALIHQRNVGLPHERVRLYSKAVELLLFRWQKEKVSHNALAELFRDERRLRGIMECLAYEAHLVRRTGKRGETADLPRHQALDVLEELLDDANLAREFLHYVDQRAGLLVGRGGQPQRPVEYSFPHRTFQEYLAGCYLLNGSDADRERRFYARAAEGDRWNLVVQLGAEELFYNTRNGEPQLLQLAYNLLTDRLETEQEQRATLWSGQIADLAGMKLIERDTGSPRGGVGYLQRVRQQLVQVLSSNLAAAERCAAGEVLVHLGDPRFRADAWFLPDEPLLGFLEIPAGPFVMGSDKKRDPQAYDEETPQHPLTLAGYYIARYPVTVAQYRLFVEQSGHKPVDDDCLRGFANHPVVTITRDEALQYCQWLTEQLREGQATPDPLATLLRQEEWQVTLPSEAEWEKAARGTNGRVYSWGDEFDAAKANVRETGIGRTSAVGCFPQGATLEGIMDMSGNVWEWTRSLWGKDSEKPDFRYPYDPSDGREKLDAGDKVACVLRGGCCWRAQWGARCACRLRHNPHDRHVNIGFRLVLRP